MAVELQNNFPRVTEVIDKDASSLVKKTALSIEADIKSDMASAKHGREYERGKKSHRASAPGEAPAVDTGSLINSVTTAFESPYAAEVGSPLETAPLLEEGTGTIAPRPAWKKAGEKAKNTFQRNAERLR